MKRITLFRNRVKKAGQWFSALSTRVKRKLTVIEKNLPAPIQGVWIVAKTTVQLYRTHTTGTLGAGLSYYMIFSIAPIMVIIVSVIGSILGPEAVTGGLKQQIEGVLGSATANQLQDMVKNAYQPGTNWIATTLSTLLLIFGAMGVFDELRTSLNIIWDVPPTAKKRLVTYFLNRVFSFGMLICIAFLLLVSLVIQTGLSAFSGYLGGLLPMVSKILIGCIEFILSFALSTLLFGFIYKFMGDVKIKLSLVWPGALFTSALFAIGKYLISLYISQSHLANTYGAASSLIVLLLWIFYSSQILFFGAEFTRALALHRGIKLVDPKGQSPGK